MGGSSFLNSFMPTLPWWFLVAFLCALATWAAVSRVRLWNAQRYRIEHSRKVLSDARDALASVISDPLAEELTRKQALAAYEAVTGAINKEIEN
jgi:hypothetical protein